MCVCKESDSIWGFVSTYGLYPVGFFFLLKKNSWFGNYTITSHGPTPRIEQSPTLRQTTLWAKQFSLHRNWKGTNTVEMKIKIIEKTSLGLKPHTKAIMLGKLKFWSWIMKQQHLRKPQWASSCPRGTKFSKRTQSIKNKHHPFRLH